MTRRLLAALAAGTALAGGIAFAPSASATPAAPVSHRAVQLCPSAPAGQFRCLGVAVGTAAGKIAGGVHPDAAAFTPTDVQSAYGLTGLSSSHRTVAIVDAFGYPNLASDLATFRSNFGLPACTVASGCLKIEGQTGGAPPSGTDSGWELEQALDVDAVSSACPDCHILVVEGTQPSFADLGTAVNTAAATAGVVAISNSYGTGASVPNMAAYNHSGIAITASTGDNGHTAQGSYPANDTHVVAVGGTSVTRLTGGGYSEKAWNGAGSGCGVSGNTRPAWQHTAVTTCTTKAAADVSAAADPNLGGLAVFDSGNGGWVQVGGTSESSPIIAAVFALSGHTPGYPAKYVWQHVTANNLHDVRTGTNGTCGVPICKARRGWDGPTGLGTPNGVSAF